MKLCHHRRVLKGTKNLRAQAQDDGQSGLQTILNIILKLVKEPSGMEGTNSGDGGEGVVNLCQHIVKLMIKLIFKLNFYIFHQKVAKKIKLHFKILTSKGQYSKSALCTGSKG